MARIDDLLAAALKSLPVKPEDGATQTTKKRYSEMMSQQVALALGTELRLRGLKEARPNDGSAAGESGAERRMAGGLGAKKVDVTWATEESGLLCAISVKTINFCDRKTGNFQKNLINRRGDMLMEAVTLHRRFPYAVLAGFFFLDKDAANDSTPKRRSTLINAHNRLQLFTGRIDPAGREEQFERFYLILLDASPASVVLRPFAVGQPEIELTFNEIIDDMLELVSQRNPDFYEFVDGKLMSAS
ncbi:MAG: hypothetical protein ABI633_02860 [Burkholderiales bacterium]